MSQNKNGFIEFLFSVNVMPIDRGATEGTNTRLSPQLHLILAMWRYVAMWQFPPHLKIDLNLFWWLCNVLRKITWYNMWKFLKTYEAIYY